MMINCFELKMKEQRLKVKIGKFAAQANGVLIQSGDTVVLNTCVIAKEPVAEHPSFKLLHATYLEKFYATGKIPGGFLKREGRPREKEILVARLIDRSLRPVFPASWKHDVQLISTVLSQDPNVPADVLSVLGSSLALGISGVPCSELVACARVVEKNDSWLLNPSGVIANRSSIDLMVSGTEKRFLMIEGRSNIISENKMQDALLFAQKSFVSFLRFAKEIIKTVGKKKRSVLLTKDVLPKNFCEEFELHLQKYRVAIKQIFLDSVDAVVLERERKELKARIMSEICNIVGEKVFQRIVGIVLKEMKKEDVEAMQSLVLKNERRVCARSLKEIRSIDCEHGLLPRVHGSGLFLRGETQSLAVITLGSFDDVGKLDELDLEKRGNNYFMLHYNFLPFCVGEIGKTSSLSRREIGHGNLAERAMYPVLPDKKKFPYTIRVVSEILGSNGSSSMASVCSASLALFDAGVPIKCAVAGISIGLCSKDDGYQILSDLQGIEDELGEIDCKVAGTKDGITVIQLDVKQHGLTLKMLTDVLHRAKEGRLQILEEMNRVLPKPKLMVADNAPKILAMDVDEDKVREIIGPGGSVLRKISERSGANVSIENNRTVIIWAFDKDLVLQAKKIVEQICSGCVEGEIYGGTVMRIIEHGVFVELFPGREGFCHISQISNQMVHASGMHNFVKKNQKVLVKCLGTDNFGRLQLSIKDVVEKS